MKFELFGMEGANTDVTEKAFESTQVMRLGDFSP